MTAGQTRSMRRKDAALRAQFQIGGYTVHATGNGGEGVAIIEIYESP